MDNTRFNPRYVRELSYISTMVALANCELVDLSSGKLVLDSNRRPLFQFTDGDVMDGTTGIARLGYNG